MVDGKSLPNDVWEAARLVWEHTPKITDREIIAALVAKFGDKAPKSSGTISKRRKKEDWKKVEPVKPKSHKKVEAKQEAEEAGQDGSAKNRKQKIASSVLIPSKPSKNNKAQDAEAGIKQEAESKELDEIKQSVVMSSNQRGGIIIKTRKRWVKAGKLADKVADMSFEIIDDINDINADAETVQKKLVVVDVLRNNLDSLTRAQKIISEIELPLCGISPEDFKQSEQERRLGMLAAMDGIAEEEDEARDRLTPELFELEAEMKRLEASPDFGADLDRRMGDDDDDDIDDVDYTLVDE